MGVPVIVAIGVVVASVSGCTASAAPARVDVGSAPATFKVTCTPGTGVGVSSDVVKASADGVHLTVVNRSGHDDAYVAYAFGHKGGGGERASDHAPWVLPAPPGDLRLSCSPSPFDAGDRPAVVEVVDPDNNWSRPETPADAGCTQDGVFYTLPPSVADTEQAALDAMVVDNYPEDTRTYAVHRLVGGYETADAGYSFVLFRNGRAAATGGLGHQGDKWSAQITGSCAERTGPVADTG